MVLRNSFLGDIATSFSSVPEIYSDLSSVGAASDTLKRTRPDVDLYWKAITASGNLPMGLIDRKVEQL